MQLSNLLGLSLLPSYHRARASAVTLKQFPPPLCLGVGGRAQPPALKLIGRSFAIEDSVVGSRHLSGSGAFTRPCNEILAAPSLSWMTSHRRIRRG
jgi:hypothetical protein